MPVYELSSAGTAKTGRTLYTSMNANNQFGAMVPIASIPDLSAVSAFTNIPQTYQDLMLIINARGSRSQAADDCLIRFNNDGSGINTWTTLEGNGTSAISYRNTTGNSFIVAGAMPAATATSGILGSIVCHILNYANTTTFKTMVSRSASDLNGSGVTQLTAGLYRSTAAVSRIDVTQYLGYSSSSTATLYGIRASNA